MTDHVQKVMAEDDKEQDARRYKGESFIMGKQLQVKWISSSKDDHLQESECLALLFTKLDASWLCSRSTVDTVA